MEKWLDRENLKREISHFLASDFPHLLVTIQDSQEFEDVTRWLEELKINMSIAYLNTDSEVTGFGLLESIVEEFGKEKFPHFNQLHSELSVIDPQIIIKQKMGSQIDSENSVSFTHNTQTLNVNSPDPATTRRFFFEERINDFLKNFIIDLSESNGNIQGFVVCRFKGYGFSSLGNKFKAWFQDFFVRKIKDTVIKLIIVCETDAGELSNSIDDGKQFSIKKLHLRDIIPVAEKYLSTGGEPFCKGAVDLDDLIIYKEFKLKLRKNIQ